MKNVYNYISELNSDLPPRISKRKVRAFFDITASKVVFWSCVFFAVKIFSEWIIRNVLR